MDLILGGPEEVVWREFEDSRSGTRAGSALQIQHYVWIQFCQNAYIKVHTRPYQDDSYLGSK